jgi:hypothetical protein
MCLTTLPSTFVSLFAVMTQTDSGSLLFVISASLYGIVYLGACALVWSLAPKIAKLVENDIPQFETEGHEFTVSNVMTTGLILLGFFVLSRALPSFVRILMAAMAPSLDTNFPKALSTLDGVQKALIPWSDIAAMVVQITFGSWLILGSRGIVTFLRKVRYAGR